MPLRKACWFVWSFGDISARRASKKQEQQEQQEDKSYVDMLVGKQQN